MSSTNGSGRPPGSISIPVEIIRDSSSTGSGPHSRHNSPYRTNPNDSLYSGYSDSPPWTSNLNSRFQPRHSPNTAYDRVITNSQFNQPLNNNSSYQQYQEPQYQEPQYRHSQQRMYEPGPSHFSRSSEDLLSSPFDSMRFTTQPQYSSLIPPSFDSGFPSNSDFVHSNKYSSPLRRSFDALNDFADMRQSFPTNRQSPFEQQRRQDQQQPQQQQPYYRSSYQTQHQPPSQQQQQQQPTYVNPGYINPNIVYTNEHGVPTDHYQPNSFQGTRNSTSNDRSRSPTTQRGASPARPSPPKTQQQEEPELKMAKDTDGPIPMPPPASASSSSAQSSDQQVPSTDTVQPTNAPSPPPPPPEPVRDPNTIALEKLEQIKQSLDALEKEVDAFTGSTRNDRSYKLLDEQALKIMIRCDELVDVSPDIKEKRKEMIRSVQKVISKLESKVPATPAIEQTNNPLETATTSDNKQSENNNNEGKQDGKSSSPTTNSSEPNNVSASASTEQSVSA